MPKYGEQFKEEQLWNNEDSLILEDNKSLLKQRIAKQQ